MAAIPPTSTAEELLGTNIPGRWELVRGEVVMMTPSGFRHTCIVSNVNRLLGNFVAAHGLGVITDADGGYLIERNRDTVRAPDVGFIGAARVPDIKPIGFFPGAPDLAVEVLSPNDRPAEVSEKIRQWLAAGCRMVWLVDPELRSVSVHRNAMEATLLGEMDTLHGDDVLPGFSLAVTEIFV